MSDSKKTPTKQSRKRRIMVWGAALSLFVVVGGLASVEVTSQSGFCGSCHIMGTYYDSWTQDAHRNIECIQCHIAPGTENYVWAKLNGLGQVVSDVLERASTKPSAAVSDFSCTRVGCHSAEELAEADQEVERYKFNHEKHLAIDRDGISIHCSSCHSHVRGDTHFELNTNVCITCHLLQGRELLVNEPQVSMASPVTLLASPSAQADPASATAEDGPKTPPTDCLTCHNAPDQPFEFHGLLVDHEQFLSLGASCESCHLGVTAEPDRIGNAQCYACHDYGIERVESREEMHRLHMEGEHKVECFSCHGVTEHGIEAQAHSLSGFDCRKCHSDQHTIQRSLYLRGPGSDAVSPMFLAHVDCTGCHRDPTAVKANPETGATVARPTPEACDECHHEGFGEKTIALWQRTTRDTHAAAIKLLPPFENPWADGHSQAEKLVEEARGLLDMVRLDGSWGVHNPDFAQQLIEDARQKLVRARVIATEGIGQ